MDMPIVGIGEATLAAYLEVIDAIVICLVQRSTERELVRLEDKLAGLAGFVQVSRFSPNGDEGLRGIDGDKDAKF